MARRNKNKDIGGILDGMIEMNVDTADRMDVGCGVHWICVLMAESSECGFKPRLYHNCFSPPRSKWLPVRAELVVWLALYAPKWQQLSCILPRELRWFQEWFMRLMSRGNNVKCCDTSCKSAIKMPSLLTCSLRRPFKPAILFSTADRRTSSVFMRVLLVAMSTRPLVAVKNVGWCENMQVFLGVRGNTLRCPRTKGTAVNEWVHSFVDFA